MLKNLIHQLMLLIDSGKLLKKPFQWLYVLAGWLCFVPALGYLVCVFMFWDQMLSLVGGNFWTDFVSIFIIILFFYALLIYAFVGYHYWYNRRENIDAIIKTGSRIVAIPLIADLNQCIGEKNSIFMVLVTILGSILAYIACLLTNGFGFYSKVGILWMLVGAAVLIAVVALLAYINLMVTRFVSERMRLLPLISNDVHRITTTDAKAPAREAENEHIKFALPKPTEREKKGAMYAVAGAAIVAFIITLCIALGNIVAMGKSVYKELPEKRVEKMCKKYDSFTSFYFTTREVCQQTQNEQQQYEEIKYRRLYKYFTKYFANGDYQDKVKSDANGRYDKEIIEPIQSKIDAIKVQWETYITEHDPSLYLQVGVKTGTFRQSGWWSDYYRPDFYFTITLPKGEIADATVSYVPRDDNGRIASNTSKSTIKLNELKKANSKENGKYYPGVDNASFWSRYTMDIVVESVTLMDGTILSVSDMNNVPQSVRTYLSNTSEENLHAMIVDQIDKKCPSREEYIEQQLENDLKEKDSLCYQLLNR